MNWLSNLRLRQIAYMYASISGKSLEESEQDILSTKTGRDIEAGDPTLLYEQQTSNLYSIVRELPENLQKRFTQDNIIAAYREMLPHEEKPVLIFKASPSYKQQLRKQLKDFRKQTFKAMKVYKSDLRHK